MNPLAERFRQERERLGISARDLALETKIREPYIEALERGRYDVLPAVYVRSFIKTIGAALHIPAEEVQSLMNATFDEESDNASRLPAFKPQTQPREQSISFSNAAQRTSEMVSTSVDKMKQVAQSPLEQAQLVTSRVSPLVGAAIIVSIISLGVWWFGFHKSGPTDDPSLTDIVEVGAKDSLVLTAIATDTAWISITMDGARTQKLVLLPEEEFRWSAMEAFVVSLGNAGAVQFFRNGRPLSLFGKPGEAIREVRIGRTTVDASNTAFKAPSPLLSKSPATSPPTSAPKPVAKPLANPLPKQLGKPVAKAPARVPAKSAPPIAKKPVQAQRRKLERELITPAPPLPIRR
ncbi:MAG: DUF4115 domain-containing protein [Candidatus Kapabacteria bacterium]|nr:DUF4115 domain-containing protein [Candidatus Kapabacteria bacterium]